MTGPRVTGSTRGAVWILVATAVGGGSGYILTILAGRALGAASYAPFAVFWSALYLVISAASGVQQEITRAAQPVEPGNSEQGTRRVARAFAFMSAALAFVSILATSPLWSPAVFPEAGWTLAIPLAVGVAGYVVVAVLAGVLYGLKLWAFIAAMIITDGVLRLVLAGTACLLTTDITVIAWCIVLPFPVTPLLLWMWFRRRVVGRYGLDVGYRALSWNVVRTVVAATATGVLVSGFPVLLAATTPGRPDSFAAILFAINLTRAPIIVVVLSLQSYLIVHFRTHVAHYWRHFLRVVGVIAAGTILLAALVGLVGPAILDSLFGSEFVLDGFVLTALVASAGLIGALCASGPAVLALGRHAIYTSGWLIAAIGTVVVLLLPLDFIDRTLLALWVGPSMGLAVHTIALAGGRRTRSA